MRQRSIGESSHPRRFLGQPCAGCSLRLIDVARPVGGIFAFCIFLAYYGLRPAEVAPLVSTPSIGTLAYSTSASARLGLTCSSPLAAPTLRLLRQYLTVYRNGQRSTRSCSCGCAARAARSSRRRSRTSSRSGPGEAGLPHSIHVYQLRHSFAMRLLGRGVGIKAIGDVMGHRSLLSTWRLSLPGYAGIEGRRPSGSFRTVPGPGGAPWVSPHP